MTRSIVRRWSIRLSARLLGLVFLFLISGTVSHAQSTQTTASASIDGTVVDAVGGRVKGATVQLTRDGRQVGETTSGSDGSFVFSRVAPGRHQLIVTAAGFVSNTSAPLFVGSTGHVTVDVELQVGPLQQNVVVTASANEVSEARTAAPVTVVNRGVLDALVTPDVTEALRLVPGAQVIQLGQRGAQTSLFVRGGDSKFNKVLIDGVPANDLDGSFDFGQLSAGGVDRVEVLRQSNSVLHGSDALSSVVSITTPRGLTRVPEVNYSLDGGNLGTTSTGISVGGAADRVDYYSQYSYFNTENDQPNSDYRNHAFAGRVGVALNPRTSMSGTLRHVDATAGNNGGFVRFNMANDSMVTREMTFATLAAESVVTDRWRASARFGYGSVSNLFSDPAPTGEPSDPFGSGFPNYLGQTVTLHGADGASITGRAILDYGGVYPSAYLTLTKRRVLSGQTTYRISTSLEVTAGAHVENERVFDRVDAPDPAATRNNGGFFLEGQGALKGRVYVIAGLGVEHDAVFHTAASPRVSVATYLRAPSTSSKTGDTKLLFNAGSGIKSTGLFQEQNSLVALVAGTPAESIASPLGPERGTNVDIGLEQGLMRNQLRVRASYFKNSFSDLIEFLGKGQLIEIGVPEDVVNATDFGGAYANAQSYDAQGFELSAEAAVNPHFQVRASYTYLDAEVTKAFSATPSFNPAFPNVPIGKYSALVGERPFRRPAHSGTLLFTYVDGPIQLAMAGSFSGRRDDSTFLDDEFYGSSMLLPNQGLASGYAKVDLTGSYRLDGRVRLYLSLENLTNQEYAAGYGYPSLPRTVRTGLTMTLGGDRRAP